MCIHCCCGPLLGFVQTSVIRLSACLPVSAGTAHVTAITLCITPMVLARQSKGVQKHRLLGSARFVHCFAAAAAAANLLLVLFLLNGRIAADTILVVHGKVAPFEWVGESCSVTPVVSALHIDKLSDISFDIHLDVPTCFSHPHIAISQHVFGTRSNPTTPALVLLDSKAGRTASIC